ncbi:MAG TPA: NADH-quinone oxidoreductase subunit C [Candidatus Subteraquimicrobiales bacterium]
MQKELMEAIASRFNEADFNPTGSLSHPVLTVKKEHLLEVAKELKTNNKFSFDHLSFVTVVDHLDRFELIYVLNSYKHHHSLFLKTNLPRENPEAPSVVHLWETADFHEREVYDLYGVKFAGHPGLKRILLAADFPGHPFRKDHPLVNDEAYLLKEGYPKEKSD